MSVRLILVFTCALSPLLGACAPDLEHMASADLVTASSAEHHPGTAIIAEQVAWARRPYCRATSCYWTIDDSGALHSRYGRAAAHFRLWPAELSRLYVIDQEGKIAVPLIGNVKARGKTTNQLQAAIRSRLGAEYVKDPQVTVDIMQNRPFFILGEVRAPGQFPYASGMTVETAVAIAGGYTELASEKTFRITRRVNGSVEEIAAPSDILLKPSDTVYVFERFF